MTTQEALSIPADQRMAQVELVQLAKAEEITRNHQQDIAQGQQAQVRMM